MVRFRKLRWKNLLSTGNIFTELDLLRSPTTAIVGKNGSGKSSITDALTFVLFNKPFRNINKNQLINSINKKDMLVEVEFDAGGHDYLVRRGMKPNVFEIYKDGNMLEQPGATKDYQSILEKTILKLNYKSFTQIVVLSSAGFTPFMQLSTADRREVIEDLLDIRVFSMMNVLLKDRVSKNKQDLIEVDTNIRVLSEKVSTIKRMVNQQKVDKNELERVFVDEIEEYERCLKGLRTIYKTKKDDVDSLNAQIHPLQEVHKKTQQQKSDITLLVHQKREFDIQTSFYDHNQSCPTCTQTITPEFKETTLTDIRNKVSILDQKISSLKAKYEAGVVDVENLKGLEQTLRNVELEIREIKSNAKSYQERIVSAKQKILSLKQQESKNSENIEEELSDATNQLSLYEESKASLLDTKRLYDVAGQILKDGGIKTRIIKQYIPIINNLVNKYLGALDFFVSFTLDEEFKEVIRSRHRDEFSYESFSEGEKSRIDIALMLTWRELAKIKNSLNTNLMILDETFDSSLDVGGVDELIKILCDSNQTNIFVISHKGDVITDRFRSIIQFEKQKNFSVIAR